MKRLALLPVLALLAIPAHAEAKPSYCSKKGLKEVLAASEVDADYGFGQIECADVTGDGTEDAVFTILSGGTAGATQFGVVGEGIDLFLEDGYKVSVDAVSDTRFDVQQPIYKKDDANCCPSAFAFTKYLFRDGGFEAHKGGKSKKPKQRFFD